MRSNPGAGTRLGDGAGPRVVGVADEREFSARRAGRGIRPVPQRKRAEARAAKEVAYYLGNTPTVARNAWQRLLDMIRQSYHQAALQIALHKGVGLAMMPSFVAARDLAAGSIEPVLTDWSLPSLKVFVDPGARHNEEAWARRGTASGKEFTVRAAAPSRSRKTLSVATACFTASSTAFRTSSPGSSSPLRLNIPGIRSAALRSGCPVSW